MIKDLIRKNRSYRRFDSNYKISKKQLKDLVDLARLSASAANLQPLSYGIVYGESCKYVFNNLAWAGYLSDWDGPDISERPTAYIILMKDNEKNNFASVDAGIACQSILLGATEMELGGCIFASIDRKNLMKDLKISDENEILFIIALGKPVEEVVLEEVGIIGDIKYWRDAEEKHHVPKRKLEDIITIFS